ncbi:MAG: hypothetical protein EBV86_12565 [Marivivens sp.]|nr:hypothetical protein [Marivivens sp.]
MTIEDHRKLASVQFRRELIRQRLRPKINVRLAYKSGIPDQIPVGAMQFLSVMGLWVTECFTDSDF